MSAGAQLSLAVREAIVVEYDHEAIGWIVDGTPEQGIVTGLLAEWRRSGAGREQRGGSGAPKSPTKNEAPMRAGNDA